MEILIYFLKANAFLVIFYGFYFLFFRKETFHKANRFFLIVGAILALALPFMKLDYFQKNEVVSPAIQEMAYAYYLDTEEIVINPVADSVTYLDAIYYFYLLGLGFSLCFLAYRLMNTFDWVKIHKNTKGTAFSFLGKIFIDNHLQGKEIIQKHESIHVKQRHFIDLMFLEILQIVFWFNPAIYFYKKSIAIIHEFLADEAATQIATNKAEYATLLISKQFNIEPATVFTQHFFNHSTLKSRIIMLSKNPSKKTALLKYVLLAPLFLLMLVASSFTVDKSTNLQTVLDKMENNISQNTITKSDVFSLKEIEPEENIIHHKIADKQENNAITSLNFLPTDEDVQIDNFHFLNSQKDTFPQGKTHKEIFTISEKSPEFLGGQAELYMWLAKNIKYPLEAKNNKIEGRVFIKFVIEATGEIGDVKVMKGIGYGCEEEAIRVIRAMPKWNPGIQKGRPVAVYYNMPIVFKLSNEKLGSIQRTKAADKKSESIIEIENTTDNQKVFGNVATQNLLYDDTKIVEKQNLLRNDKEPKEEYFFSKTKNNQITLNGTTAKPLVFVDGKELFLGMDGLSSVKPETIESISVVKEQSKLQLYGPRAKDGVILIKTKTNFIKTDDKK